MTGTTPCFRIQRVYDDGVADEPKIIPVTQLSYDVRAGRRGFLGAGLSIAAVLAATGGRPGAAHAHGAALPDLLRQVPGPLIKAHPFAVRALSFTPDGTALLTGAEEGTIKRWSIPGGQYDATVVNDPVPSVLRYVNVIRCLALTQEVVSGWNHNDIRVYQAGTFTPLTSYAGHTSGVIDLVGTPDGQTLLSASKDGTVRLWSVADRAQIATLGPHPKTPTALALSPDGRIAASACQDGLVRIWSSPDATLIGTLAGHPAPVESICIAPDGQTLVSSNGGPEGSIRLWEIPSGRPLAVWKIPPLSLGRMALSPDGSLLVVGGANRQMQLRSFPDGAEVATLMGHPVAPWVFAFHPDGSLLASGDAQGVVILWDLRTRSILSHLFDPSINRDQGLTFTRTDEVTGQAITYSLPCGSPVPPNAVCTCNCVPGALQPYVQPAQPGSGPGGGTICTCNTVCTCIPVFR